MSNPFDQFTVDVQAALPPVHAAAPYGCVETSAPYGHRSASNPYGGVNAPSSYGAPDPYMNAPSQYGLGAPPPPPPSAYGQSLPSHPPAYGNPPNLVPPAPESYPSVGMPFHQGQGQGPPAPASQVADLSANPFDSLGASDPATSQVQYLDPWGAPQSQPEPSLSSSGYGAPVPPPPFDAAPQAPPSQPPHTYGMEPSNYQMAPPQPPPPMDYGIGAQAGALVVSDQQSNPYAQLYPPPPNPYNSAPPSSNPYGAPAPQQYALAAAASQPYGTPAFAPPSSASYVGGYALAAPVAADPFSVFESTTAPATNSLETALVPMNTYAPNTATTATAPTVAAPVSDDEFWGSFAQPDAPATANDNSASDGTKGVKHGNSKDGEGDEKKSISGNENDSELPPGGEWYDARIFTPTLGVMFFKPQELTDSLFLHTDKSIVDALADRPMVAFIVEGSSARAAGVELGHVLLKVNGVDVKNPKEASRLIKEGPRPLPLLFYVPNAEVVVAEGEHMVKYDTKETMAPNSVKDWKPKYVVIGGIISQPWMINMYRSKSEYDIAVIETQARRPVSVKVKQFSLQGARIQNDWQGPQMVKYKNKLHPWKYIVVLPVARNPIKISSPNLTQLKPVHEGIRRVLLAQQRVRGGGGGGGGGSHSYSHSRDPHRESSSSFSQYGGSGGGSVGRESSYNSRQSNASDQQEQQQQQQSYYNGNGRDGPSSSSDHYDNNRSHSHNHSSYGHGSSMNTGDPFGGGAGGYTQPQQQSAYQF